MFNPPPPLPLPATSAQIKAGAVSDVYFQRTAEILDAKSVDAYVRAEFVAKSLPAEWEWAVFAGLAEVTHLLDGIDVKARAMEEGAIFRPLEPVLEVEGSYREFGVYETAILGLICQASGIATRAARCRNAAGPDRRLISFGARRMHPAIAPMIERAAYLGGCDGVAVIASAELLGTDPVGTIPHALILVMGDTVRATQAFDEVISKKVPRIALIDTFTDEKFAALEVAEALGPNLAAIRLDTPGSRRGDFFAILSEVRWELDLRGYNDVDLFVSGGIDEDAIRELNPVVDGYGIGTWISGAPVVDFSMDIVEIDGNAQGRRVAGRLPGMRIRPAAAPRALDECRPDRRPTARARTDPRAHPAAARELRLRHRGLHRVSQSATPQEIVDFFLDPANYEHPVDSVVHTQTHVSHLFFAGDYVYKVKKPVDMGFLDFSTLEKRRDAALAELQLNRRVAPDIYIDVAAVHRDEAGQLSFIGPAIVEEVAVVMKRLPDEQRLSKLVETGAVDPEMMSELGRLIAGFHEDAETSDEIAKYGSLETIRHNWDENFEQTQPVIGRTLTHKTWETCKQEIERYMRAYAVLFERRVADGWIRDCHGDLQTDDIFIDPETGAAHVLDCIEFNERFRYSDTLADVAFLSMDLRNRDREDLARAFLDAYYEHSPDEPIPSLLRFYESYRAYVRGKVRGFVIDQEGPSADEKAAATAESRRFLELALADALRLRPRLVLVMGLMGSGKTKQSDELGRRAGGRVLHSDVMRKQLAGIDPNEAHKVPFGTSIYSGEWTDKTYRALIDEARQELAAGNSIVLDASWSKAEYRVMAREVAAEREALFAIVECTAPKEALRVRLSKPTRQVTDGRLELADDQRASYEAPSEDEADRVISIDTTGSFERAASRVHEALFA